MYIDKENIILKNRTQCTLRTPFPNDAKEILLHRKITSQQTDFMARYPEEIILDVEKEAQNLQEEMQQDDTLSICAEVNGRIIAHGGICPVKRHIKYLHRATFGISIQKDFWNLGIGSEIMSRLISAAKHSKFEQIELEVVATNEAAIALYKKQGFKIYGTIKHAFKYKDGTYGDEHLMMLEL